MRGEPGRPGTGVLSGRRGLTLLELMVSIGILAILVVSFAGVQWQERRLAVEYYQRAVVMQLVDGEMEALAAGEWKAYGTGTHAYTVAAESAKNLPPGRFTLTVDEKRLRLEWAPAQGGGKSRVTREADIR